ncbi:MAG: CotH kinase family protein, partial [Planctomycetota bacterium]
RGNRVDRVRFDDRAPWPREADEGGASIELLDPSIPNDFGAAWAAGPQGGSPGQKNRRSGRELTATIDSVYHRPAVPEPGETVTFYANAVSGKRMARVYLYYYEILADGKRTRANRKTMEELKDGLGATGRYRVQLRLPKLRAGSLLGYRVEATDSRGGRAELPRPPKPGEVGSIDFLLKTQLRRSETPDLAHYQLIFHPLEWAKFKKEGRGSVKWFPCTFATTIGGPSVRGDRGRVFHSCLVRYRGNNSRRHPDGRMSFRLKLAPGDHWDGRNRFILNAYDSFNQKAGGDFMRSAGLPAPRARHIRLTTPGADDLRYLDIEVVDSNFLEAKYGDSGGILFRGFKGNPAADFSFHGNDPDKYRKAYRQENHSSRDGVPRIVELLEAIKNTPDETFVDEISKFIDIDEWVTYFAANRLLGNDENGLAKGVADDYFLLLRPDGKFDLIPWDHDSVFFPGLVRMALFKPALPAIRKLLQHPKAAPLYRGRLEELLDTSFSRASIARQIRGMTGTFRAEDLKRIENFTRERQRWLREQLAPTFPRIEVLGAIDGEGGCGSRVFVSQATQTVELGGSLSTGFSYGVRVGGRDAKIDSVAGRWSSSIPLRGDQTEVWVEMLSTGGSVVSMELVSVDRARLTTLSGELRGAQLLGENGATYLVSGDLLVAPGASLTIAKGTEILCADDVRIQIAGQLDVEGTRESPVVFRSASSKGWRGIELGGAREHTIRHCRFEGGGSPEGPNTPKKKGKKAQSVNATPTAFLTIRDAKVRFSGCTIRGVRGLGVHASKSRVTASALAVLDSREGIVLESTRFVISHSRVERIWGDGIQVRACTSTPATIDLSSIRSVQGRGLIAIGSKLELKRTHISGTEVAIEGSGGSTLAVSEASLAANGALFRIGQSAGARRDTTVVTKSALGFAPQNIDLGRTGRITLDGCRVHPGLAFPEGVREKGTVYGAPAFRDPLHGDFRLMRR